MPISESTSILCPLPCLNPRLRHYVEIRRPTAPQISSSPGFTMREKTTLMRANSACRAQAVSYNIRSGQ